MMHPIILFGKELNINPIAFEFGGLKVYWYGLIILTGFLAAYFLVKLRLKDKDNLTKTYGIKFDDVFDFAIYALIVGILSARLYYVIFNFGYYKNHLNETFMIWNGGIAIYGAIIGAAIMAIFFCSKRKIVFWDFADLLIPYVALAQSIGRWGNFVNQEAFGYATNLPWKMGVFDEKIGQYIFVHPTFLYESICTFAIFIFLLFVSHKRKFNGQVFCLYAMLYGTARMFIEGLRTDSLMLGSFRISQVLSMCFVIIFGITYFYRRKGRGKTTLES